jgi:hypothetical protein
MNATSRPLRRGPARAQRAQRGVTLIVALIMLTALGLIAASALRASNNNLRIVDNTRARQQAFAAAQTAVERTISDVSFVTQPQAVAANGIPVDLDGDGTPDLMAQISPAPSCYRWRAIKVTELDPAVAADRACLGSSAAINTGVRGGLSTSEDSLCANSEWNVRAVVTDPSRNAVVQVNQGIALRTLITEAADNCP